MPFLGGGVSREATFFTVPYPSGIDLYVPLVDAVATTLRCPVMNKKWPRVSWTTSPEDFISPHRLFQCPSTCY